MNERVNICVCISIKSFNMSFYNLYLNVLRRDLFILVFMMVKFLIFEK